METLHENGHYFRDFYTYDYNNLRITNIFINIKKYKNLRRHFRCLSNKVAKRAISSERIVMGEFY
jgi:cytidylate kinase